MTTDNCPSSSTISRMKIGFLGLGKMGAPMARHLIAAGHELRVWNRTEGKTKPLLREGAIAAATPAEAELDADVVITMLFDDAAHEEVLFGANGLMDALSPGALHISCSTISVALSERLTQEHARRGHEFVAAPVFGRPNFAEEGRLWVVAAGAEKALAKARPLLETFSRGISIVGVEPRQANAVKLGGNFLISAMLYSLSEGFVFAEGQGIDPAIFYRDHQQRTFSVAVLCSVQQSDAQSARTCRSLNRVGRERHKTFARSGREPRHTGETGRHSSRHFCAGQSRGAGE